MRSRVKPLINFQLKSDEVLFQSKVMKQVLGTKTLIARCLQITSHDIKLLPIEQAYDGTNQLFKAVLSIPISSIKLIELLTQPKIGETHFFFRILHETP